MINLPERIDQHIQRDVRLFLESNVRIALFRNIMAQPDYDVYIATRTPLQFLLNIRSLVKNDIEDLA